MKLSNFEDYRSWIDGYSGCYRIGYYYHGDFNPCYIGKGENIYERIKTYMNPNKCHNKFIAAKLDNNRHNLWFQYQRTSRFHGLEARHQHRHGTRAQAGLYVWNQKIEKSFLYD